MAIDAFVTTECPTLPVVVITPSGAENSLNLNFEIGNSGNTTAVGTTLVKTVIIPAGAVITVLDNGGATVGPANGTIISGPAAVGFVFTDITLPAISGSEITLQAFVITLLTGAATTTPATIMDITQIVAPGDVNLDNNSAICEVSLR